MSTVTKVKKKLNAKGKSTTRLKKNQKITSFVKSFYLKHGEVMSKLANE